jgi:hypothetical protein
MFSQQWLSDLRNSNNSIMYNESHSRIPNEKYVFAEQYVTLLLIAI